MADILIIDDEPSMCELLSALVQRTGHACDWETTLGGGLDRVVSKDFDIVFLDVNMPDGNGLDILPKIRKTRSMPEVIIITGFGNRDGAEIAIKNGAWDYIQKSSSPQNVVLSLKRALQYREEVKKSNKQPVVLDLKGIIGSGTAMKSCYDQLAQAAGTSSNVLITGETGTGKELFARAIHRNSPRSGQNFVVVDCTALPENLVESLLFGYEKGAFTGAYQSREGLVSLAHKGTLFLDEVGELPMGVQKIFLRVLQERKYRPIGSKVEVSCDFRLVAATNRDLQQMGGDGLFREDLLFRIRSLQIQLPPLRKHMDDLKELILYYVDKVSSRQDIEMKGFSSDFFQTVQEYSWPGNIRELIAALETAISAAGDDSTLFSKHLPDYIRIQQLQKNLEDRPRAAPTTGAAVNGFNISEPLVPLKDFRMHIFNEAEKQYLQKLISVVHGDFQEACWISGVSRSRLYELLKKHDITI